MLTGDSEVGQGSPHETYKGNEIQDIEMELALFTSMSIQMTWNKWTSYFISYIPLNVWK